MNSIDDFEDADDPVELREQMTESQNWECVAGGGSTNLDAEADIREIERNDYSVELYFNRETKEWIRLVVSYHGDVVDKYDSEDEPREGILSDLRTLCYYYPGWSFFCPVAWLDPASDEHEMFGNADNVVVKIKDNEIIASGEGRGDTYDDYDEIEWRDISEIA